MERVRIAALFADKEQYGGASVTVCGWAKTIRDMKTFGFIELNDGGFRVGVGVNYEYNPIRGKMERQFMFYPAGKIGMFRIGN